MPLDQAKAFYARWLKAPVAVRRYTGTGPARTYTDYPTVARLMGYRAEELIGAIEQGDRRAIVYAPPLAEAGLALPVTTRDKLLARGRELAILAADHSTRRLDDELIAIEIQARG